MRVRNGKATFAAADGFRLIVVECPDAGEGDWSAILDGPSVKAALPALKQAAKVRGTADVPIVFVGFSRTFGTGDGPTYSNKGAGASFDGRVVLTFPAQTVTIPTVMGTFPNYDQLIPAVGNDGGNHAAFDGALIGDVFRIAGKYATSGIVRTFLQSPSAPARLNWVGGETDAEWHGTGVVMPMFVTW